MYDNVSTVMTNIPSNPSKKEEACKIFVGGLSWDTTRENLAEYFCHYGQILDCVLMLDPQTRRSRGFGFVTYNSPQAVYSVLANGPHFLDGKFIDPKAAVPKVNYQNTLKVQVTASINSVPPVVSPSPIMSTNFSKKYSKIFVGGIGQASEEDLRGYFSTFGRVNEVSIIMDKLTGRPRGFAFVGFDDYKAAEATVGVRYHCIRNKKVEVKKALPRDIKMMENCIANPNGFCTDDMILSGLSISDNPPIIDAIAACNGNGISGSCESLSVSPQVWKPSAVNLTATNINSTFNVVTDGGCLVNSVMSTPSRLGSSSIHESRHFSDHLEASLSGSQDNICGKLSTNDAEDSEQNENSFPHSFHSSRIAAGNVTLSGAIPDSTVQTSKVRSRSVSLPDKIYGTSSALCIRQSSSDRPMFTNLDGSSEHTYHRQYLDDTSEFSVSSASCHRGDTNILTGSGDADSIDDLLSDVRKFSSTCDDITHDSIARYGHHSPRLVPNETDDALSNSPDEAFSAMSQYYLTPNRFVFSSVVDSTTVTENDDYSTVEVFGGNNSYGGVRSYGKNGINLVGEGRIVEASNGFSHRPYPQQGEIGDSSVFHVGCNSGGCNNSSSSSSVCCPTSAPGRIQSYCGSESRKFDATLFSDISTSTNNTTDTLASPQKSQEVHTYNSLNENSLDSFTNISSCSKPVSFSGSNISSCAISVDSDEISTSASTEKCGEDGEFAIPSELRNDIIDLLNEIWK